MSNSRLVSYIDTSTPNWDIRKHKVSRITIHHAAGICTLADFSKILADTSEASWNYAIGNDGRIGLYVDESHRAWTSSSADNDDKAITIEVSNSAVGGSWPISEAAYRSLINLCEDICRRNGIKNLTYTGKLSGSNLTMHEWFYLKNCPGPYLKSRFAAIASAVNARLAKPSTLQYIDNDITAYNAAVSGTVMRDQINHEALDPYVVTIDRRTSALDYPALKKLGVVGVMIEAGRLYDAVHQEQSYRNPRLPEQARAASDANIPFALYTDVQARSVSEAKKELYELSFCIRKYPPALGVWLKLGLCKSKSENNKIIDTYYDELVRLGLKGRIGIYATKEQLSRIDWKTYSDKWYLWLEKHVADVSEVDQLLTPHFFVP